MAITVIEPRALKLRTIVERAVEDSLREPGRLRGYGADTGKLATKGTPDAARQGILSFATMNQIFERNDLVRATVMAKARQLVSLGWDIGRADEERFVPMGLARYVKRLFQRPNTDGEDWTQMMLQVLQDALVLDAGAIEKVRDAAGEVVELVPRDGSTFVPLVDAHRRLKGYEQVVREKDGAEHRTQFKPSDIVYLRFNPRTRSIWGLSPIETLALTIGGDILAMQRNVSWMQDGNLADNIVVMGRIGATALKDFRAFFDENAGDLGKIPVISDLEDGGVGAKVLPLRQGNRDMQFMEWNRWCFQRICAVYQISADDVIQLEATATKATAETQHDASETKGLKPERSIIEGLFTQQICAEFHPNLAFTFVELDKTDSLEEAQVHEIKARSGFTINELRVEAGKKPIQGQLVDVDGVMVNVYDLPMNPASGQTLGLKGSNPFEDLLSGFGSGDDDEEGGDFGDPKKTRALSSLRVKGRRISSAHPERGGLLAYEARRAVLAGGSHPGLRTARGADTGAARSGVAATLLRGEDR